MRQEHTNAKKARRFSLWSAFQNDVYSTPVFWRRVKGFFGADSKEFDKKHPSLSGAVDGMKSRIAAQGNHRKV